MQVLARANRERLAVLLGEAQRKDDASEERYAAALRHVPCDETPPTLLFNPHIPVTGRNVPNLSRS